MENNPNSVGQYNVAPEKGALTVVTHYRQLHMYQITLDELSNLHNAGNYKTLDIALFSLLMGAFIALFVTLLTVDIPAGKIFSGLLMACFGSGIGLVFFGIRAVIAWKVAKTEFDKIRQSDNQQ